MNIQSSEALLSDDVYEFVKANAKELDQAIDYKRDFGYGWWVKMVGSLGNPMKRLVHYYK